MARISARKKLVGGLKKHFKKKKKEVEITPLMSFKHLIMLNSASKCLKISLVKVIKFSKPDKIFPKKLVDAGISPPPPCQIHAGGKSPTITV
jgi:hypothetical protein